jgi:hypothetical protein
MNSDPSNPRTTDKDTPDPRPVHEAERDKLYGDPGARRPRLPDTEGENVDPEDGLNPPPRPVGGKP